MKLESIALHEGYQSEETTKAAVVPISTFVNWRRRVKTVFLIS